MKMKMIYMVPIIVGLCVFFIHADDNDETIMYGSCDITQQEQGIDWIAPHNQKRTMIDQTQSIDYQEMTGRAYYEALVEKATQRSWAAPITLYGQFTSGAFDDDGQKTTFGCQSLGSNPRFKDIYLFAKLSDDNKVRIENRDAQGFERGDTPLNIPGGQFGNFRDDLFTTLLAPTQVRMNADVQEFGVVASLIHRCDLGHSCMVQAGFGLSIPIKSVLVDADVHFVGGELFREAFAQNTTQRENSVKQFYREYIDIFDFFERAILNPKGLTFAGRQRTVGIGDMSLFGYLDFARYFHFLSSLQIGMNIIVPTSGKPGNAATVFQPSLGNGGAVQFDFFGNVQFATPLQAFNPTIRLAVQTSAPVTSSQRIPTVKVQPEERVSVSSVDDLYTPEVFQAFHVDMYQELDTTVPFFADGASSVRTRGGTKVLFSVGNYFYNPFDIGLRFGIMYSFMHKQADTLLSKCANVSAQAAQLFTKNSAAHAHSFDWQVAYQFKNLIELNFGFRHVFAGRNVPKTRELYGSFVLTF